MLSLGIGFLAFISSFSYTYYQKSKYQNISAIVFAKQYKADSLMKSYKTKEDRINEIRDKIKKLYDIMLSSGMEGYFKDFQEFYSYLSVPENVKDVYELISSSINVKRLYRDLDEFSNALILKPNEKLTKLDSTNYRQGEDKLIEVRLHEKIKTIYSSKILSLGSQVKAALWAFISSVTILFLFRYLYYAVKWSWKILKE
ncbi:hypothetical protein CYCD_21820 [Tenuifilaceae bacterium CYCD]|nr:hypothetical protein CYCD_21820 [Tenuifilaceae bacterium CYCD]